MLLPPVLLMDVSPMPQPRVLGSEYFLESAGRKREAHLRLISALGKGGITLSPLRPCAGKCMGTLKLFSSRDG